MNTQKFTYDTLPVWYKELFKLLLSQEFPGRSDVERLLNNSEFTIIDESGSLSITNIELEKAGTIKKIPVEAYAYDKDGMKISALLFMRNGNVKMLEFLRGDGMPLIEKPNESTFKVLVLGK